jgi:hypothetical protein
VRQLLVHRSRRQDIDFANYLLHTFDVLYSVLCVRFVNRLSDFTHQRYGPAIHLVGEAIENSDIGKHRQFVAHLLLNAGLGRV